jgi:hypothetical protein
MLSSKFFYLKFEEGVQITHVMDMRQPIINNLTREAKEYVNVLQVAEPEHRTVSNPITLVVFSLSSIT